MQAAVDETASEKCKLRSREEGQKQEQRQGQEEMLRLEEMDVVDGFSLGVHCEVENPLS